MRTKVIAVFLVFFTFGVSHFVINKTNRTINISLPSPWGSLVPGSQHTMMGSIILKHQFDSLVQFDRQGVLRPGLAVSWVVNDQFTDYEFVLDTKRQFSDGSFLTAADVKQSWEDGLRERIYSTNHSMDDVFSYVVGYEKFKELNRISGIEIVGVDKIRLRFRMPYRLALENLSGVRFAITKKVGDQYFGTGPYTLNQISKEVVELLPNKSFNESKVPSTKIVVRFRKQKEVEDDFKKNLSNVALVSPFELTYKGGSPQTASAVSGGDYLHIVLALNGMKGRLFSNAKYRRAFQFLVHKALRKNRHFTESQSFTVDPQIYQKIQLGRLADSEANLLVDSAQKDVDAFLAFNKKHPLVVMANPAASAYLDLLKQTGVSYKNLYDENPQLDFNTIYYKTFEPDVALWGFSILYGDPDTVYHALGSKGAITSKIILRPELSAALEKGKALLGRQQIEAHYENVSRLCIQQVPFIHLGFTKSQFIYNSEQVTPSTSFFNKGNRDFMIFETL